LNKTHLAAGCEFYGKKFLHRINQMFFEKLGMAVNTIQQNAETFCRKSI